MEYMNTRKHDLFFASIGRNRKREYRKIKLKNSVPIRKKMGEKSPKKCQQTLENKRFFDDFKKCCFLGVKSR